MNIGTLTIEIAANLARLQSDMDQTKKIVSTAMKDVETYVGYAKTAFIGFTGVASFGAFVGIIQGGIEARARLYDLSLQTGISVQALSALGKVGKYTNTSLDEIAGASNKLSKALFTQNEESKGAAQALKAMGIDFDRFRQLQPDQQLLMVAKAMAGFQDGTGKSAAAMLLFGKTGATLLPFLKELAEKNELVGKVTTESAKAAKEYEKNLIDLKAAGDEWKKQLVGEILPTLLKVTNALVDQRKAYGGWLDALRDSMSQNPFAAFGDNGERLKATSDELERLRGKLAEVQALRKDGGGGYLAELTEKRLKGEIDLLEKRAALLKSQQARDALALGQGVGEDPRLRRPTLSLTPPADKAKAEAVKDEYAAIIQKINEKISAQQLELDSGQKLTAGQEEALRVMERIRAGLSGTTREENALIGKMLERMLAGEKLVEQQRRDIKFAEEARQEKERLYDTEDKRLVQLREEAIEAERQAATYGMTREQLQELESARLRDAAAAKERRAALFDDIDPQIAESYRDQADQLRRIAEARDLLASKEQRDHNDPSAGAARAFKEYSRDVQRAGDSTYYAVRRSIDGLEDLGTDLLTKGHGDIKAWVTMVISEINRLYVVRPLLDSIFGAGGMGSGGGVGGIFGSGGGGIFQSLFGGAGGGTPTTGDFARMDRGQGGGGGSIFGSFASSIGSFFSGFFADGGFIEPGRWGVAGERGPEPVFGGRTGVTVQASAQPEAAAARQPLIQHNHFHITGAIDRRTQAQIAVEVGNRTQRALVRNS